MTNPDGLTKRVFTSGASRDTDLGKPDYEGFFCPLVWRLFGDYMHRHRHLPDGSIRPSDNWQRGIPKPEYAKSLFRHFMDFWLFHRGYKGRENLKEALCGIIFNAQGYLHEILKAEENGDGPTI